MQEVHLKSTVSYVTTHADYIIPQFLSYDARDAATTKVLENHIKLIQIINMKLNYYVLV